MRYHLLDIAKGQNFLIGHKSFVMPKIKLNIFTFSQVGKRQQLKARLINPNHSSLFHFSERRNSSCLGKTSAKLNRTFTLQLFMTEDTKPNARAVPLPEPFAAPAMESA